MIHRFILSALMFMLLFLGMHASVNAQSGTAVQKGAIQEEVAVKAVTINYTMPYAGILPDNPLYFLKNIRDGAWLFFTRDAVKKAELLLLFADKQVVMAQALAEKDKWDLAIETLKASQKDIEELMKSLELARKIGSSPSQDFLDTIQLSSAKHLEIMEDMLPTAPTAARHELEALMQVNVEQFNRMERL